ncbi:TetR/AcrR family transcriptional regulator [Wenzhouxiangella marina]|uniref:Transcriptional regulator n=1 Tax=Wenzhouxiangella marina TaxID=1579979 RepID=A0A0K0XWV6_9GAMM|nr:TetR/AcrR family transcriptional regulator [Wenzhouxiangella marina]AKS42163.1 Transcriptional regulator [Wenzhouxiangella marina]MBB6086065.1 AcrR family transcriptional regulator [Wenzhouxiangella marina]
MARNTRERILAMALVLFNEDGEPHVTTNRIADELEISPGNLHYHFRTKGDLIEALFAAYEGRMLSLLTTPDERNPEIEDIWLFLHLVFETIGEFRFFYRDLSDLCSRFRGLHQRFRGILRLSMDTARALLDGLADAGHLDADEETRDAMVRNLVLVSTFWLAFDQVLERDGEPRPDRAVTQVMSIVSPCLDEESRIQMQALAAAYR